MTRRNRRQDRQCRRGFQAEGERLDPRTLLSGIIAFVDSTADSNNQGTLRFAISQIDSVGSPTSQNSIVFQIPKSDPGYNAATGTFTIRPQHELPPITSPAFVDGLSEAAFLGEPALVVIDGSELKVADGLTLAPSSAGSTIDGLEIANFGGSGIVVESSNNTVGGAAAGEGNILASNNTAGISFPVTAAAPVQGMNNVLLGNFIGTDVSGANLGNGAGVICHTSGNTIGGITAGAANVIGFNTSEGILISGVNASENVVLGNFIGTNSSGANLGNPIGVNVGTGSNTIGGTSAGMGNVFGFNTTAGLQISGVGATGDVVAGNLFGTSATGANVGNSVGVDVGTGGNSIGGTTAGSANVFGFNGTAGVMITGAQAAGNVLLGNFIGTNVAGANLGNSVGVVVGSAGNAIGGTTAGSANVFGFNSTAGVMITGAQATGNVLIGNFIGTNAAGANLSNAVGVELSSGANTIGGVTGNAGNVISFNSTAGVQITGAGASGNVLIGNFIGTDSSGQAALGNDIGVLISGGAANTIGGTTAGAGNVISGNFTAGIELSGASVSETQISGNRIGTNPSGTRAVTRANTADPLSNLQNAGIAIIGSAGNTVGGTSSQAGNLISGNYVGVMLATITGSGSSNLVSGNLIGTDASGSKALGNIVGIYINGASGNQIGGTAAGAANTVSGNSSVGVEIYGSASTANVVEGNLIGLAADGHTAVRKKNGQFVQTTGVFIENASGNLIGGSSAGAGNVISGNQMAGVYIRSHGGVSGGNIVQGNRIGLASGSGRGPGNNGYGVLLLDSPRNEVDRTGSAANRFGRNSFGNYRSLTGASAATSGSLHTALHPAGPARHRGRRSGRGA